MAADTATDGGASGSEQQACAEVAAQLEHLSELSASPSAALGNAISSWFGGQPAKKPRPADRPLVIVFVLGGVTYAEARSVEEAVQARATEEGGAVLPQIVLGSTTIATRDHVFEQGLRPREAGARY